ncbi:MAG: hypothetical protein WCW68_08945, partial [Methanothrix sp.]
RLALPAQDRARSGCKFDAGLKDESTFGLNPGVTIFTTKTQSSQRTHKDEKENAIYNFLYVILVSVAVRCLPDIPAKIQMANAWKSPFI